MGLSEMKTRTHFAIELLNAAGEIQKHLAGVGDYLLKRTSDVLVSG